MSGPRKQPFSSLLLLSLAASLVSGCGGDSADAPETPSPPTTAPAPTPAPSPAPTPAPSPGVPPQGARWQPQVGDTWQWQLKGTINAGYTVKVYDIDLIDTPADTIAALHAQGRRVVCYFSAGSSEDFRSDFAAFNAADKGRALAGWDGERWLDIRSANVRTFMTDRRLDLAVTKGCDGVEPDNVDGYANTSGFPLTAEDQLSYNHFLADEAHKRGLAVGLKNDLDQVAALVGSFDFAVNEQCHEYDECVALRPFTQAGKPVFNAEYMAKYRLDTGGARQALCATARAETMRTLVLPLELDDSFRFTCDQ